MTTSRLIVRVAATLVMLDRHRAVMEELLVALTSVGRGFGAGLGMGLDTQAEVVLRGEWGGLRATWEEVSKDK